MLFLGLESFCELIISLQPFCKFVRLVNKKYQKKMKKIITVAILSLICNFTFAQSSPKTTAVVKESSFVANKVNGEFNFQMPEGTSPENIVKTANYYTAYFTVKYDLKSRIANIKMVEENSNGVILRFLISNDIKTISYDGKEYEVENFVGNFVQ